MPTATKSARRGPRLHRLLIRSTSVLLTVLFFWLIQFALSDIGRMRGPDRQEIIDQYVSEDMTDRLRTGQQQLDDLNRRRSDQQEIQSVLQSSLDNARQGMNQLIEIHRLTLEQAVTPTREEQLALAESERLFLERQQEFQAANEEIAGIDVERRETNARVRALQTQITEQTEPALEDYRQQLGSHRRKVAAIKLAFLVPLLLGAAWLVMRHRGRPYAPIVNALFVAAFAWVVFVMNDFFPARYFKYVAIAAGLGVVLLFMVTLIRTAVAPKLDWLLKQYRDAYNRRECPICAYPIRRGPFKHAAWTRKGPIGMTPLASVGSTVDDEPYACPSCGSRLYEKCDACGAIRHALLPFCEGCGAEKEVAAADAPGQTRTPAPA